MCILTLWTAGWWVLSVLVGLLSIDYDAEESPVTEEEERPLSQEELRKRIMKKVSAIVMKLNDYLQFTSWCNRWSLKYFVHLVCLGIIYRFGRKRVLSGRQPPKPQRSVSKMADGAPWKTHWSDTLTSVLNVHIVKMESSSGPSSAAEGPAFLIYHNKDQWRPWPLMEPAWLATLKCYSLHTETFKA